MEYKRLTRCGIDNCKQTLFFPENGRWFCKNGHMRAGELDMAADDEGFGQVGARAARAPGDEKKRVLKVLRGRKGFELYLCCLQVLLRKQVGWLVQKLGVQDGDGGGDGKRLEEVVRDLWALRLRIVADMLPESVATQSSQPGSQRAHSRSQSVADDGGYSSSSNYLYTSDSDTIASTTYSSRRRRQRRVPKATDRPRLIESLALCYLGLLLMRYTVTLGDIHTWVEEGDLVFVRAIKEVPPTMREKLSAEYYTALEPMGKLAKGRLYKTVHKMVALLHEKFGITFPPVNRELLLGRVINDLGLPLEIYTATKRLADLLYITLEWPSLPTKVQAHYWPEAKFMSLVIVAAKLCYGLDSHVRTPLSATEPAATQVDWDAWERFLLAGNGARLGPQASGEPGRARLAIDVKEHDVFDMHEDELDWYLDWYEKTWCDDAELEGGESSRRGISKGILNLFPTARSALTPAPHPTSTPPSVAERLATLHATTTPIPPSPAPNPAPDLTTNPAPAPGEHYLWSSTDEEQPHALRTLTQAAADLLALEREDLQKVVTHVERRIREQVLQARRRRRREEAAATGQLEVV
ncbi:hypothetical protein BZA05DRAFT_354028 [Tricharina praecox]|uniref:uncharacterized protein n=1 Tax=Tricharina praecox TaxID=43433 RepID=UPI00221FCC30|nr:uncharacterized protein BZA05DRAFT_354028 [Tricharina praecox]KAI5851020.1 hypothetical protein BZA05DRAFT_354028 [Tricharina praecox]